MALVDADCKFLYVDVGSCGRASDGRALDRCSLKQGVEGNVLDIPQPENIPLSDKKCPYVFAGDDAFPLKTYLMKPYPGWDQTHDKITYNYRVSRARRTSKNAFGILAARFQIFKQPIRISPEKVNDILLAAVTLHNMLHESSSNSYTPPGFIDAEDMESGRIQVGHMHHFPYGAVEGLEAVGRGHSNDAKNIREKFRLLQQ
ncbi:protein ALP1-like [Portunus trituberculatus]|uniref:protein ALP1-like n=1 Tax=Portunus trituberculatus TaxID=210409 RepID=UPI001E1CBFBD|nr:protein ALP1-like [Portunus trituberculatus]